MRNALGLKKLSIKNMKFDQVTHLLVTSKKSLSSTIQA